MNTRSPAQAAVCRRFCADAAAPLAEEELGIALATLHSVPLNAIRHRAENGTCGWYIWAGEELSEVADFFEPLHVAHIGKYVPSFLPYMALPPGWRVLLAPGQEDAWFDEGLLHGQE